jgi:uncharacterized RDD family membrane protein YckC
MSVGTEVASLGFGRRLFAYLIDLVLLYIPLFIGDMAIRSMVLDTATRSTLQNTLGWSLGSLMYAAYFITLWMSGGTVGQRILGLKLVSANGTPSFAQSLSRLIALVVVQVVIFSVIGFLVFVYNRSRERPYWHDTVSRTTVIRRG